jgi:hypothetical protein
MNVRLQLTIFHNHHAVYDYKPDAHVQFDKNSDATVPDGATLDLLARQFGDLVRLVCGRSWRLWRRQCSAIHDKFPSMTSRSTTSVSSSDVSIRERS